MIGCTTDAPVPSNELSWLPESIVEASSTLGLKSKLSLNSYLTPVVCEVYDGPLYLRVHILYKKSSILILIK